MQIKQWEDKNLAQLITAPVPGTQNGISDVQSSYQYLKNFDY